MKKTLLVTNQFPPDIGGTQNLLYNVTKRLDPEKLIVLADKGEKNVLHPKETSLKEIKAFDERQKFKIIRSSFFYTSKFVWPRWMPVLKKLREIVPALNIENIVAGQVLPMGAAARIVAQTYQIPYSVYTYGMDIEIPLQHWRRKKTLKSTLKDTEHIFTISEDTKRRVLRAGGTEDQIVKINPGLDVSEFIPNKDLLSRKTEELIDRYKLQGKKVIVTVGRTVARKGQDTVLKSLPKIIEQIPEAHYVIAGGGEYLDELKSISAKLNLEKHVTFTGRFPDDEKAALYNLADVVVMISRVEKSTDIEGFGIVYLEANALGKPVVAGRSGGVEDAVIDHKTGLLVDDPTDTDEVSKQIVRLLRDEDLANRLGEQGRERVGRDFDWNELVSELESYL